MDFTVITIKIKLALFSWELSSKWFLDNFKIYNPIVNVIASSKRDKNWLGIRVISYKSTQLIWSVLEDFTFG